MREIKDFTKPMKLIYMERMFMKKNTIWHYCWFLSGWNIDIIYLYFYFFIFILMHLIVSLYFVWYFLNDILQLAKKRVWFFLINDEYIQINEIILDHHLQKPLQSYPINHTCTINTHNIYQNISAFVNHFITYHNWHLS